MLDPFYPIVDSADWVARLLPQGARLVQLRVKDRSDAATRDEIARTKTLCAASLDVCRRHGCQLIVNDYWQAAIDLGCDFVHLGQEDLDDADIPAIRAAGLRLGVSTHDEAELSRALELAPDYIALGPIYPTRLIKQTKSKPTLKTLLFLCKKFHKFVNIKNDIK